MIERVWEQSEASMGAAGAAAGTRCDSTQRSSSGPFSHCKRVHQHLSLRVRLPGDPTRPADATWPPGRRSRGALQRAPVKRCCAASTACSAGNPAHVRQQEGGTSVSIGYMHSCQRHSEKGSAAHRARMRCAMQALKQRTDRIAKESAQQPAGACTTRESIA